ANTDCSYRRIRVLYFFFFSSRRRHTRWPRDWSSDVCSSDLPVVILPGNHDPVSADSVYVRGGFAAIPNLRILGMTHDRAVTFPRSEERRVGKECRSRWSG